MEKQFQLQHNSEVGVRDRITELSAINRLVVALNDADTLEEIYAIALDGIQFLLKVNRLAILILDSDGFLKFAASRGISEHYKQAVAKFMPSSWSNEYTQIILRPDLAAERSLEPLQDVRGMEGIRAIASFPLIYREQQLGRIVAYYNQPYQCSEEEIQITETIATYTAVAVSRKQVESALRQKEEMYRLTFEQAAIGVSHTDLSGRYLRVNQKLSDITGYTQAELLTKSYLDITYADDVSLSLSYNQRLQAGEIPTFSLEKRYVRKDGSLVWVHLTVSMIFKHSGEPDYVMALAQDISDRISTEEALRRSQDRLELAQKIGKIGIFEWDMHTDAITWNEELELMFGLAPGGFTGKHGDWFDAVYPEDLSKLQQEINDAVQNRTELNTKFRIIRPDGNLRWLIVKAQVFTDAAGNLLRMIGVNMDVTKSKQTEEALRESDLRLRLALEASRTNVWEVDLIHHRVHLSRTLLSSMELESGERDLPYAEAILLLHPEDRKKTERQVKSCILKKREFHIEHRVVATDGSFGWILTRGKPIYDAHGNPLRLIGTSVDISDRKLVEQELSKSKADLAEAQRVAHMGNWEFNLATQTPKWSAETFRIFGRSPDQGEPSFPQLLEQHVHPEDREIITKALSKSIATKTPYESEYRALRPNGEVIYVHAKADPLIDDNGKVVGFFGTVHDVSDRKRAEEMRMKLEKDLMESALRTRFFSMASHELRTPLSTILMAAGILEYSNNDSLNEKSLRNLYRIQTSAKHLQHLLDQILTISRAETDKISFNPQPLELNNFCCQLVEEIYLARGNRCSIRYINHFHENERLDDEDENSAPNKLEVLVDEKLLYSILTNLLLNAIKYSAVDKEVLFEIEVKEEKTRSKGKKSASPKALPQHKSTNQGTLTFRIQDQGIGIPPEDQKRLFEAFYRGQNVDKIIGSGLGLTIVKKYVELHKGTITLESKVNVGTTFIVTLPLLRP